MRSGPLRRICGGLVVLACGLVAPGARSEDSEAEKLAAEDAQAEGQLPGEIAKAFEEARGKIESLGGWCAASEMNLERSRIADVLLLFDRDHVHAHEWLGARRQKNGSWKPGPWHAYTDQHPEKMAEYAKIREATLGAFRDALVALLEKCHSPITAASRDRIVRTLVDLWPEDSRWHAAHGEVQVGAKWLLRESAETPKNRQAIAAAVTQARAEAKAVPRRDPRSTWTSAVATDGLVVEGSIDAEETSAVCDAVLAARSLVKRVLGGPAQFPDQMRIFLLADMKENQAFVGQLTTIDAERRTRLAQLGSYWFKHNCVVVESDDADRLDTAVRQTIDNLDGPFVTLSEGPPLLSEGIGTYLTYKLLGTRLTAFISSDRDYTDDGISRETAKVDSDWVVVAKKLVDKGFALDLPVLLGLPLNSMGKDDGLLAYAFAAYLLEGRPAETAALLKALRAKGSQLHEALPRTFGQDEEGLQDRFVRWLHEVPLK